MIPEGTRVFFGAAATPMDPQISNAITNLVIGASSGAIEEAHLPLTLVDNFMERPEHVLVLIGPSQQLLQSVLAVVGVGLQQILPSGQSLAMLPMLSTDALVPLVREAGCKIFPLPNLN